MGGFTVIIMQVLVQIVLNLNYQLELSLAKEYYWDRYGLLPTVTISDVQFDDDGHVVE